MSEFYIDTGERKKLASFWIKVTMAFLHVWACVSLAAIPFVGSEIAEVLSNVFATTVTGIGITLLLLIVGDAAGAIISRLFGPQASPVAMSETITKTTTVQPSVNDVIIKPEV